MANLSAASFPFTSEIPGTQMRAVMFDSPRLLNVFVHPFIRLVVVSWDSSAWMEDLLHMLILVNASLMLKMLKIIKQKY